MGISISYAFQEKPQRSGRSICHRRDFIKDQRVALILGDNIFFGQKLGAGLQRAMNQNNDCGFSGDIIRKIQGPMGLFEFNREGKVLSLIEKPLKPKSVYLVHGLYFYNFDVL